MNIKHISYICDAKWSGNRKATVLWLLSGIVALGYAATAAFGQSPTKEPSTASVIASGERGGALVPTRAAASSAENQEMLEAMGLWNAHRWSDGVDAMRRIWQQSPGSPWAAEAELHEACYLKFNCRYAEAEERFLSVFKKHPDCDGVRKKVFYYLPHLYALTGRLDDALAAQRVLGEFNLNWQERQFLENQMRQLSVAKHAQDDGRLCGTKALALALAAAEQGQPDKGLRNISYRRLFAKRPWALERSDHPDGYSISDLLRLGGGTARRVSYSELCGLAKPGRPVIAYLSAPETPKFYEALGRAEPKGTPRRTGHFIVVEKAQTGYLEALDPSTGRERWDSCMFQARWSGVVILAPRAVEQPGQPLDRGIADVLRGGCCGSPPPDPQAGPTCPDDAAGSGRNGPQTSVSGPGSKLSGCVTCKAPSYMFGLPSANFVLVDTPMWYPDANGPSMGIELVYNRINSGILSDTNTPPSGYYIFGNKWSFNYNSFVKVTPSGNIQVVMPDGLVLEYATTNQVFTATDIRNRHSFAWVSNTTYYCLTLDGSQTQYYYSTNTASQAGQQVEQIKDRFGDTLTMTYNANGKLTNVMSSVGGRSFRFVYNAGGHVTNVTDLLERSCSFGYSGNGNLVSMTDMGGYTTTLQYNTNNWVTGITYPNNSTLVLTYETGLQIGDVYSNADYAVNNYPAFRIRVMDSLNRTNEYMYHAFYTEGPATVRDTAGNIWLYNNDSGLGDNRRPAIFCEGVNDRTYSNALNNDFTGKADQWVFREFGEGNNGNLLTESRPVNPSDNVYEMSTDGLVRTFGYDNNDWMTSETWWTAIWEEEVGTWTNAYDTAGNRIYTCNPLGAATYTAYDSDDLPIAITNALNQVTSLEYDGHGNLTRLVNPRSATFDWEYDSRGLCTLVKLPDTNTVQMTYDIVGRLATVTDPVGLTVSNQYDNLDRVTSVRYPDGTTNSYNYSCCALSSVTDRLGRQTTFDRDILGRVTNVTDAASQRVKFTYGAGDEITSLTVWQDGTPRTTQFAYTSTNGFTRLTQRTSPLGKTAQYDYTFRGALSKRTDGLSRQTQYQYDQLQQLTQISYPGGNTVGMDYDVLGLTTKVAGPLATNEFAYDALGRVTNAICTASVPGMTPVQYAFEYTYDAAGNVTDRTLRGLSGFSQVIPTHYEYDSMDRLTLATNALASASYGYDKGRLATKSYGNGDSVNLGYDIESRLTNLAIQAGGQTLQQFAYTYNAMGMMLSASSAQQTIEYGYDSVYQLTSEVVNVSGTITTNSWQYDTAGNVRNTRQGTQQGEWTVNADNELSVITVTSATGTGLVQQINVTGQVDAGPRSNKWYNTYATARGQTGGVSSANGSFTISNVAVTAGANALTVTVRDVSANVATQIVNFTVATTNSSAFAYDANGNLTNVTSSLPDRTWYYEYDIENRLTKAISNNVTVFECWYDSDGRRIAKREVSGSQTNSVQYVWDGWELVAILGGDGQLQEHYTRGVGVAADIGSLVAATHYTSGVANVTRYLHNNHRGDVVLTREGTNTVATFDYTAYGELRSQAGSYRPRLRFSTKEYDASTGFYHFPYRYYAPMWARWVTRDPIEEEAGINLYAYVDINPVGFVDPLGLVNMNLYPRSEGIHRLAANATVARTYSVGAHGSQNIVRDANGNPISPRDLARDILRDRNYQRGQMVTLGACNTGAGRDNYARRLANELTRQSGVRTAVQAPDRYAVYRPADRNIYSADWNFLYDRQGRAIRTPSGDYAGSMGAPGRWNSFTGELPGR